MDIGNLSYPIGTLFLGTGKANNVWIINTDNTRSISKLWDGKQARWCTSEAEYPDQLKAGPHNPATRQEVLDFITNTTGMKVVPTTPQWAKALLLTSHKALTPKPPPTTGLSPAVVNAMIKSNILSQPKEEAKKIVASVQDLCKHTFTSYVGIREVYDFCTKCDFKVRGKQ